MDESEERVADWLLKQARLSRRFWNSSSSVWPDLKPPFFDRNQVNEIFRRIGNPSHNNDDAA